MEESTHSRQPLVRISKDGQMRLKNKVAVAILRENTYEDRALKTKLKQIQNYKKRQEQTLTHRQLEFATTRITEIEKEERRPQTIGLTTPNVENESLDSSNVHEHLPKLSRNNTMMSLGEHSNTRDTNPKAKWEKAINLVRLAVSQPRKGYEKSSETHGNRVSNTRGWKFVTEEKATGNDNTETVLTDPRNITERGAKITTCMKHAGEQTPNKEGYVHNNSVIKAHFERDDCEQRDNREHQEHLPPLNLMDRHHDEQHVNVRYSRRRKHRDKHVSLPELIQVSREKSLVGISDPRFKRLESCLVMKPASMHAQIPDEDFLAFTRKKRTTERKSARKKYKTITFALPRETQATTPISVESYKS